MFSICCGFTETEETGTLIANGCPLRSNIDPRGAWISILCSCCDRAMAAYFACCATWSEASFAKMKRPHTSRTADTMVSLLTAALRRAGAIRLSCEYRQAPVTHP